MAADKEESIAQQESTGQEERIAEKNHGEGGGKLHEIQTAKLSNKKADQNYIVGIGASAGGFEALEMFFDSMPSDSGMTFVVVQHLSPDHKSLMVELLSKHTKMKVLQAEENMQLLPDCVYLIPPKKVITVEHGRLRLMDKANRPQPSFPIDIFLQSLAENQKENAIAIILSGTGSDGTRGIRAIKEENGMIMVQDLNSAKFDGMPRNAIATGLADYILPPDQMPDELLKYTSHPVIREEKRSKPEEDTGKLGPVFLLLKSQTGVDFTYYKQTTVKRRITRRLSINQLDNVDDYIKYLYQNPEEVLTLYKELLIGVTRFFRDPEAFDIIKEKVLPEIFKNNKGVIRCWVGGCSTGEEAYSMAMLCREYMEETGDFREVKIFATDVDKGALEYASNGQYPENIIADLSPERFNKFFSKAGDSYQVVKPVREMVIFAVHNILKDPPFNKIDFLSCRNLLIYLQPTLQHNVLSFFNFALKEDGFLFLGSSETVGGYANLFSPFHTKWRIYRCRGRYVPLPSDSFFITPVQRKNRNEKFVGSPASPMVETPQNRSVDSILDKLMERYIPPAVIINHNYETVHIIGDVNKFVKFSPGKMSLNISGLIRKDLTIAVETGVNRAIREEKDVVYNDIYLHDEKEEVVVDLTISPFEDEESGDKLVMVLFEEVKKGARPKVEGERFDPDAQAGRRIKDLEQELQYTKENLQATIEEVETTNEELQATNEELLSANEELQSTNEELQSVNEELITVNAEYQSKIQELTELNNDMNNLLSSTEIGVIFLDRDLSVRKFTPAIREEINLMDFDIGRPITHISFNIDYNDLVDDVKKVLKSFTPVQKEVTSSTGKTLLTRILPYVTTDDSIKGVIITFVDITNLRETTDELYKLSQALKITPSTIAIAEPDGQIIFVNDIFESHSGISTERAKEQSLRITDTLDLGKAELKNVQEALENGDAWVGIVQSKGEGNKRFDERVCILPVKDTSGEVIGLQRVGWDVSDLLEVERKLRKEQQKMQRLVETSPAAVCILSEDGNVVFAGSGMEELMGIGRDEVVGRKYNDPKWGILSPDGSPFPEHELPYKRVMKEKQAVFDVAFAVRKGDGTMLPVLVNAAPVFNDDGSIDLVVCTLRKAQNV